MRESYNYALLDHDLQECGPTAALGIEFVSRSFHMRVFTWTAGVGGYRWRLHVARDECMPASAIGMLYRTAKVLPVTSSRAAESARGACLSKWELERASCVCQ
jgi:hypothetical protein